MSNLKKRKPNCHPGYHGPHCSPECEAPLPPFCPPPKHCSPECEAPLPPFCPPPKPGFPPKCPPPVPSVVEGESLYEAMNRLTDRVNTCISVYNEVMANAYASFRRVEAAAAENGAFYNDCDISVEEGYDANEGATYKVIRKKCVDSMGSPIRMQLYLAYDNTTNPIVNEGIMAASSVTYADKIISAIPSLETGWYGNVIYRGCPLPHADEPNLFTVGFTKAGVMRVYNNNVNTQQMLNDTIENAMGCSGVLIQNGQLMSGAYIENIPNYSTKSSRIIMGQNLDTRDVFILTCESINTTNKQGMSSLSAAKILLQYGCDIAVELCEGISSGAMSHGQMIIENENFTEPKTTAYWVISRRCHFHNDYQYELNELAQNYGKSIFFLETNSKKIDKVQENLEQEIENRINADNQLQTNIDNEAKARQEADENLQTNINLEAEARQNADELLQENINREVNDRITAVENEKQERIASDTTLQNNIDAEAANRLAEDRKLQDNIDAEAQERQYQDGKLQTSITNLTTLVMQAEENISIMQANLAAMDKKVEDAITKVTELNEKIENIINGNVDIEGYLKTSGGTMSGNIDMDNNKILNLLSPINNNDAVNKIYVDNKTNKVGSISINSNQWTVDGNYFYYQLPNIEQKTYIIQPSVTNEADYEVIKNANFITQISQNQRLTGKGTIPSRTLNFNYILSYNNNTTPGTLIIPPTYVLQETGGGGTGDYLPITGGTLSGNLQVGTAENSIVINTDGTINNVMEPVNDTDAVNKSYVDSIAGGLYKSVIQEYVTITPGQWTSNNDGTYLIRSFMSQYPNDKYDLLIQPDVRLAPSTQNLIGAKAWLDACVIGMGINHTIRAFGTKPTVNINLLVTVFEK